MERLEAIPEALKGSEILCTGRLRDDEDEDRMANVAGAPRQMKD